MTGRRVTCAMIARRAVVTVDFQAAPRKSGSYTQREPYLLTMAIVNIARGFRIWWVVLNTFVQDSLVYRANAVIWMLTDVVTAVTMPLIWLASYNGRPTIHGFSPSQMVVYYLVILAVSSFVESHVMWEISHDVKQGKFNVYLIRPYSFAAYTYAANLGWRLVRTSVGVPLFALVVLAFHRYLPATMHVNAGPTFWLAVLFGHFLSFTITHAIGLLSLWLYEVRSVYNFYYLPLMIFSGQIAPIALFPRAIREIIYYTPFPYTLAFPADIFLGRASERELAGGFIMQLVWIGIASMAAAVLWRGGVRRHTAFGIECENNASN
jgi:ABC-2 type transport system permease protein